MWRRTLPLRIRRDLLWQATAARPRPPASTPPPACFRDLPAFPTEGGPAPGPPHPQTSIHRGAATKPKVDVLGPTGAELEDQLADPPRRRHQGVASFRRHERKPADES